MLSGIPKKKNNADASNEKNTIEELALKRFMEALSKDSDMRSEQESDDIKLTNRKKLIDKSDSIALERILGDNDLLPISYLQTGLKLSESVCRIVIRNRAGTVICYGTGFLVSPEVVLTNNHVISDIETASYAVAEFNYQNDENFKPCAVYDFELDPERFFMTDEYLDFTLVALNPNSSSVKKLEDIPHIRLISMKGKIVEGEYVSIIQHPNGGPKAVTLRENKVQFLFDDFVHYMTDTEPGSSGSPVFNDQWITVALHHSGVPDPNGKGKWIANEGIRISSVAGFVEKEHKKADIKTKQIIETIFENLAEPDDNNKDAVDDKKVPNKTGLGYNPLFLGDNYRIDLPKLSEQMEEDSTKQENGSNVLDYVHFSIVMCKSRGLAYYTVVNIDGNKRVRIPRGEKGDNWKYDSKIDQKYQYGHDVYANNPLDKGHLVRRIDPAWGEDAKQANDDTFHYTNCAPQHENLNQKIWLGLEDYLLRNAHNHGLKVSVFTGPVFRDDDKLYRNKYKIPSEFWKVAVMVKDDGNLSATAYIQSQRNMIENLEFVYGPYQTYQVPVHKIEELTGLDFGDLSSYDPIANVEFTGLLITDEEDIRL